MAGPATLDWAAVANVLGLYGLWDADVHRKLRICIRELLTLEQTQRGGNAR